MKNDVSLISLKSQKQNIISILGVALYAEPMKSKSNTITAVFILWYRFRWIFPFHIRRKTLNHVYFNGRLFLSLLCFFDIIWTWQKHNRQPFSDTKWKLSIALFTSMPSNAWFGVCGCLWYRFLINSIVERLFIHQTRLKYAISLELTLDECNETIGTD